ncbi:hypothetical protein FRX31_018800 [Thalictrum thalictroides]|uniref:Uncharacterized protein n=1 Tax=Thalictrum thalictroides TaxID=46969 RepID=A0A7J6W347_THATH|nr:hypothetical protein FRX31_018800 [Thalictrum thalictroides]
MASQILEFWRKNLKSCSDSGDIFEVINRAIFIAGLDHPKEFKNHREEIIEKLYKTEVALAELNREKQKVLINASKGFDQVAKKVDKESPSSTVIDHVEKGVQISASDSDHVAVSNTRNNKKILPIIRMKRVKKMNSEDDWVVTIVPRKMEAGSGEEASKYCYNGGGECQAKSSSGSVHNTSSSVLKEENTKEVQTTTRVGCLHEEALIQRKLETSKRKLEDGYQATAKRQHLIKVLDPCDLPKIAQLWMRKH